MYLFDFCMHKLIHMHFSKNNYLNLFFHASLKRFSICECFASINKFNTLFFGNFSVCIRLYGTDLRNIYACILDNARLHENKY